MEAYINKNYNIEIEIISPLNVGAGAEKNWVRGIDFIYDRQKKEVYKLNLKKLSNVLAPDILSNAFLQPNEMHLRKMIISSDASLEDVADQIFYLPFNPSQEIKTHIKDGKTDKPFIPGSSIKGAIRSILFSHLKNNYQKYNEEVFGSIKDGSDFMRFIRIGDAFFDETQLMQTKIFNLHQENSTGGWEGGWKHAFRGETDNRFRESGFVTTYEVLETLEKSTLRLGFSDKLFHKIPSSGNGKKSKIMDDGIEHLFSIINKHTRSYLEKEKEFFNEYPAENSEIIEAKIDYLLNLLNRFPEACLFKMAAGSGFHAITGDWRFNDHITTIQYPDKPNTRFGKPIRYKSRKISFAKADEEWDFIPMGFVMLALK
jgi:hypothetical protein